MTAGQKRECLPPPAADRCQGEKFARVVVVISALETEPSEERAAGGKDGCRLVFVWVFLRFWRFFGVLFFGFSRDSLGGKMDGRASIINESSTT